MNKLNNKGYMLVEIILAFVITFLLLYFMMDLVIKLKNKNDDLLVETVIKTDSAIITNKLMEYAISYVDSNESAKNFCDNIKIDGQTIKYNDQVINVVDDIASIVKTDNFCTVDKVNGKVIVNIPVTIKQNNDENYNIMMDYNYVRTLNCNPVKSYRCKKSDGSWIIQGSEPYAIDYDGKCEVSGNEENWKIKFLSTGKHTLKVNCDMEIDAFLVGGGGNGGTGSYYNAYAEWEEWSFSPSGGGGGGGKTSTLRAYSLLSAQSYNIVVGAAASDTSAFNVTAKAGTNGSNANQWGVYGNGGSGGSGGGGGTYAITPNKGGSDGSNGISNGYGSAGNGQGTTTKEFGEPDGKLYSTGGSGGAYGKCATGSAADNTGNGGMGGGGNIGDNCGYDGTDDKGQKGGSGIVVIRNSRYLTVSFDVNGGVGSIDPITGSYGTIVTLSSRPNIYREGYEFLGWSYSKSASVPSYKFGDKYTITGSKTLYAVWRKTTFSEFSYICNNVIFGRVPYTMTYTGDCTVIDDGNDDWRIKFLSTGAHTLTFTTEIQVDAFLVGGGGNGGTGSYYNAYAEWEEWSFSGSGGGGGGGKTYTLRDYSLQPAQNYNIVVGAAASDTSAFNVTAKAGSNGSNGDKYGTNGNGGSGGSGGGGGNISSTSNKGGTNGNDGETNERGRGGQGQKTTTREFGEPDGTLYSAGGLGGVYGICATGSAAENTGNGGMGGGGSVGDNCGYDGTDDKGQQGGSGIVIIRNKR